MRKNFRVRITKTNKEWESIDRHIRELYPESKLSDIERYNRYLNNKISMLINDYENCPDCVKKVSPSKSKERQKVISPVWYERLLKISEETNISISALVDTVIVTPLLIEK